MKKLLFGIAIIFMFLISIGHAQSIISQINKIDVDFKRHVAMIYIETGYYDQNNVWQSGGTETTTEVDEPAFDTMINALSSANALDMNAVQSEILNTI